MDCHHVSGIQETPNAACVQTRGGLGEKQADDQIWTATRESAASLLNSSPHKNIGDYLAEAIEGH